MTASRAAAGPRMAALSGASAAPFAAAGVVAVAEVVIATGHVLAGAVIDACLVAVLVNAERLAIARRAGPDADAVPAALRAVALVALVRVIAVGMPLHELSPAVGHLLVASLVGLAAFGLDDAVGRRGSAPWHAAPLALPIVAGLVLGLIAYLVDAPALAGPASDPGTILLALAAAALAATVEEVVFRGVLQPSLVRVAPRSGAIVATGLFVSTYLGFGSAALVVVVAVAGTVFARVVAVGVPLRGAILGHVLLAAGAAVVWPVLLGA